KKIALFASLPVEAIISAWDVENIYRVPLVFREQGVDDFILGHFGLEASPPELSSWEEPIARAERASREVRIALVGKYVQLEDAYLSVCEALRHAAAQQDARLHLDWIDSEALSGDDGAPVRERLARADGVLIPGGFGGRGIEGKIDAAAFARERGVPFRGICLGMHVAVAEFARHVAGMEGAQSTEMHVETPVPVIDLLPAQQKAAEPGGTRRRGAGQSATGGHARARRKPARPAGRDGRRAAGTRRRARAPLPQWNLRGAVPDREPVGQRAGVRAARDRGAAGDRRGRTGGRRGRPARLGLRQPARAHSGRTERGTRPRWRRPVGAAVRAPGH